MTDCEQIATDLGEPLNRIFRHLCVFQIPREFFSDGRPCAEETFLVGSENGFVVAHGKGEGVLETIGVG